MIRNHFPVFLWLTFVVRFAVHTIMMLLLAQLFASSLQFAFLQAYCAASLCFFGLLKHLILF